MAIEMVGTMNMLLHARWSIWGTVLTCVISVSCTSGTRLSFHQNEGTPVLLKKTVIYQVKNARVSYSVTLSEKNRNYLLCSLQLRNLGREPVFVFLSKDTYSQRSDKNRAHLLFSIGDPYMYSDFVIPQFDEVGPGSRAHISYDVDCRGPCDELNFVDVTFYMIVHYGQFFHDLFKRLPHHRRTIGLNIGTAQERFYSYIETETVSFTLVPTRS